ncbi:hypothetical protein [Nisaea sp.]|uniref:hypothetical protein n=1 Tax=Nisaea sp. TaxID=2024842 RepID=UPI00329982C7
MAMSVDTKYYSHPNWPQHVAGPNGFYWNQYTVTVGPLEVSPLNAPAASYFLMARDVVAAVNGTGPSWRVAWSTETGGADPGVGMVAANSATVASITEIYLDDLDDAETDRSGLIAQFDSSTSTVKGKIGLSNIEDRTQWVVADVIGTSDNDGYWTISVQNPVGPAAELGFESGATLVMGVTPNGDAGDAGTSLSFGWIAATAGGDPGAGLGAANHADLALATELYLDELDAVGVDISAEIIGLNGINHSPKAIVVLRSKAAPSIAHRYSLTGVTDGAGFMTLTVTHLSGAGAFADGDPVYLSYSTSGNDGIDGEDGGTGPAGNIGDIPAQTETTDLADDDLLVVHDDSAGGTRKITVLNARKAFVLTASLVSEDVDPAVVNTRYVCDTSVAPFTITLPAAPAEGDTIGIADAGDTFATKNLTIARNGKTIAGAASDLVVDLDRATFVLIHISGDWRII